MNLLDRSDLRIPCPACKREMAARYGEVFSFRKARCRACGAEILFDSIAVSALRAAGQNLERAQEQFEKAKGKILDRAEVRERLR